MQWQALADGVGDWLEIMRNWAIFTDNLKALAKQKLKELGTFKDWQEASRSIYTVFPVADALIQQRMEELAKTYPQWEVLCQYLITTRGH